VLGFLPMPYMALYSATKHAVAGYSESLDHELRTQGIRVSVVEPAYINTPFDANLMKPDAPSTCIARSARAWRSGVKEVLVGADGPEVVADSS
jgi:short-subunit dehydrogenase